MFAETIAARLLNIMSTLIHRDQSGFTIGWQVPDATGRLIDVIHYAESSGTPSLPITSSYHWTQRRGLTEYIGIQWTYLKSSASTIFHSLSTRFLSWHVIPNILYNKQHWARMPGIPTNFKFAYGTPSGTYQTKPQDIMIWHSPNIPPNQSVCGRCYSHAH